MAWRSTTLGIAEKHCPRALDHYKRGVPYWRDHFAVGVAAHACIEECGKEAARLNGPLFREDQERICDQVCAELIGQGRGFEGYREPPMKSSDAFAGRDLALSYMADCPLSEAYRYEEGLAVNRQWMPCPYTGQAWLKVRIDAVGTILPNFMEDDHGGPVLEIRDYKSAWNAAEGQLRTIQRKIQAVLAWDRWGEGHVALRLVVVNLRTRRMHEILVYPNTEEGAAVMAQWRRDIETEIAARESQVGEDGWRPASPGAGCMGCPYLAQCAPAQEFLGVTMGSGDPEELARRYAVHEAMLALLKVALKEATAEAPIEVPGGVVGTLPEEQRTLGPQAIGVLAAAWERKTHPTDLASAKALIPGLLTALKLGLKQAESLLSYLYRGTAEEREKRAGLMAQCVGKKIVGKFGVHRGEGEAEGEG